MESTIQAVHNKYENYTYRQELLEQAFDVIMKLDDIQLKCLMERIGFNEHRAS